MESNITNKGWRVAGNTGVVVDKDGWMVAHAGCSHEAAISADFNREISSRQECAHLIAAAPDLYEALKTMYEMCNLMSDDTDYRVAARKAIAKAESK